MKKLACVLTFIVSTAVEAQLSRAAVSITGVDTNPCTVAAPCRSFSAAINQTSGGGEVIALDSGGYGPFNVTQSVTVMGAPGVHAGITALGGNAINVSLPPGGNVVLRTLYLNGGGTGNAGISFTTGSGAQLHVENVFMNGFTYGVYTYWATRIDEAKILNCSTGVYVDNAGAAVSLSVNRLTVDGLGSTPTGFGLYVWRSATVGLRDSLIMRTQSGVLVNSGAIQTMIESTSILHCLTGLDVDASVARISNCLFANNDSYGVLAENNSIVESWGNNRMRGNQGGDVV